MARSSAALTGAVTIVREAVVAVAGNGVTTPSQNIEIQLKVKASDLIAALTAAELAKLRQVRSGQTTVSVAFTLTNDDGTIMTFGFPGWADALREALMVRSFSLSDDQQRALTNRIAGRPDGDPAG